MEFIFIGSLNNSDPHQENIHCKCSDKCAEFHMGGGFEEDFSCGEKTGVVTCVTRCEDAVGRTWVTIDNSAGWLRERLLEERRLDFLSCEQVCPVWR